MDLDNYKKMDPVMLMSIVNMKIRDQYNDLDNLVKAADIDKQVLIEKLAKAGFDYLPEVKQFR